MTKPPTYSVVPATRTDNGIKREGWIVERVHGPYRTHISILYDNPADAEIEIQRLISLPEISPGKGIRHL